MEITSNQSPPRSGAFEVTMGDNIIFSKFKSNRFPTKTEIQQWISL